MNTGQSFRVILLCPQGGGGLDGFIKLWKWFMLELGEKEVHGLSRLLILSLLREFFLSSFCRGAQ